MNKTLTIVLAFIVTGVLLVTSIYNDLNRKEEIVFNSWGNLESSLQRRFDLIPNLVNTVKGYANHESKTLIAVIEARSKVAGVKVDLNDEKTMQQFMAQQSQLQGSLHKLMAVVESYPDLKANQNFLDLQHQLEGTENRINYARNQYNKSVQDFNTSIRKFPNSLVNSMFAHLDKKLPFQANEGAKDAPVVNFG